MRPLRLAIALSAAVHGAALGWVASRPPPKPEAPPPVTTTVEIIPAPPPPPPSEEPVAVALLDDHTSVPTGPATAAATTHATGHARGHAAISTGSTGPGGTGETPATPGTGTHSPLMGMRGGEHKQLSWNPSDTFSAAFDAYSAAHPPDIPPPPSGELQPSGGGTYTSDHPAFTAKVDRAGTAHIEDKADFEMHGLSGRASFDDWAMRQAGIDPYSSAKRQWLDKTRDERARIGMAARKEDLARAPEFMKRNLRYAWARTEGDVAARKEALFDLWDDCAETGDDDLVTAGSAARTYLVGFIRAHLPQGAPGAFTPDDLTRLNARKRSHATFQPY